MNWRRGFKRVAIALLALYWIPASYSIWRAAADVLDGGAPWVAYPPQAVVGPNGAKLPLNSPTPPGLERLKVEDPEGRKWTVFSNDLNSAVASIKAYQDREAARTKPRQAFLAAAEAAFWRLLVFVGLVGGLLGFRWVVLGFFKPPGS